MNQDTLNSQVVCRLCLGISPIKVCKLGKEREETSKEFPVEESRSL